MKTAQTFLTQQPLFKEHVLTDRLPPPLKWAGGKRWQLPLLRDWWRLESHRRLVEPFCGGLAVALGLLPSRALLNDINPHLVNFYRWLQQGLDISIEMANEAPNFYEHRRRFNHLLRVGKEASEEAASLFYYLNRTAYNGLCRFNRAGEFNVPFGSYKTVNYRRDFSCYRFILSNWKFTNTTFSGVKLQSDDFVYGDPPYDVEFTHYSKDGFTWVDQIETAEWLARHPGPVVLSNQATQRIIELYSDLKYTLRYVEGPRRISCTGDRRPATEILAFRNLQSESNPTN